MDQTAFFSRPINMQYHQYYLHCYFVEDFNCIKKEFLQIFQSSLKKSLFF